MTEKEAVATAKAAAIVTRRVHVAWLTRGRRWKWARWNWIWALKPEKVLLAQKVHIFTAKGEKYGPQY